MNEAVIRSESSLAAPAEAEPEWVGFVRRYVASLRFGVVQLVVHDGRVTQIERTEKLRLRSEPPEAPVR